MEVLRGVLREVWRVADAEVIGQVARLARNKSARIRAMAIAALGTIPQADAIRVLIELVSGRDMFSTVKALEALFAQPNPLVADTILGVIAAGTLDEAARERLATELRRLRPEVARNALFRLATGDRDPEVRRAVRESLEAIEEAP